ncbi:MAG: hypothetical protein U9P90_02115 [Patescibacteria group bacterium]|nr:hypothetical protein [Patescibacteria group bacterium]
MKNSQQLVTEINEAEIRAEELKIYIQKLAELKTKFLGDEVEQPDFPLKRLSAEDKVIQEELAYQFLLSDVLPQKF